MREDRPGEPGPRRDFQSPDLFHSRTVIGQISSIKEKEGIAMVRIGINAEEIPAIIPMYGLCVRGAKSSWGRYMPEQGAFVKCSYGPDDRLELVGYAAESTNIKTQGTDEGEGIYQPDIGGYGRLKDLEEENVPGLNTFRKLKGGEWDFRSSGNAYFHLSNAGHALLAGGLSSINLDKERFEAIHEAGLISLGAEGSFLRLGDIKRNTDPSEFQDQKVNGASKEYHLKVAVPVPNLPALTMVDVRAGDIREDGAASSSPTLGPVVTDPATGATGAASPLRYRLQIFDQSGLIEQLNLNVDVTGHVDITQALAAAPKGLRLSSQAGQLITSYLKTNIFSSSTTNLDASTAVLLGDETTAPSNSVVLGTDWTTARAQKNTFLSTAHTTYGIYFTGATAAWAAVGAFLTAYAANPIGAIGAANAAAAPVAAMAGFSGNALAQANFASQGIIQFESKSIQYLSLKVFTE